jgi:hypothetical protein
MDSVAGQIVLSAIEAMVEFLNFAAWKPQKVLPALRPAWASHRSFYTSCRIRFEQSWERKLSCKS